MPSYYKNRNIANKAKGHSDRSSQSFPFIAPPVGSVLGVQRHGCLVHHGVCRTQPIESTQSVLTYLFTESMKSSLSSTSPSLIPSSWVPPSWSHCWPPPSDMAFLAPEPVPYRQVESNQSMLVWL